MNIQSQLTMLQMVSDYINDPRTKTLFALILIDVVTGIMGALRTNTFKFKETARFYETNILPYVLGYLLYYVLIGATFDTVVPNYVVVLLDTVGFGTAVTKLVPSITKNVNRIQTGKDPIEVVDASRSDTTE